MVGLLARVRPIPPSSSQSSQNCLEISMLRFVVALSLFLQCLPTFAQRVLPNQVDLTAAYCQGVLAAKMDDLNRLWIDLVQPLQHAYPQLAQDHTESVQKLQRDLRRIDLYLVPRLSGLRLEGLVTAKVSGKEDQQSSLDELKQCTTARQCKPVSDGYAACIDTCSKQSAAVRRTERCTGTAFLPQ